jgi:DNA-directed RNA polymerase subunit RPC12/RpoP
MGSARFETVLDFARLGVDVAIRCDGCKHKRNLTAEQLATIFGLGARLATVRRRLTCSKCGHKGASLAPIPRLDP